MNTISKRGSIRIGTSNIVLPINKGSFPPAFQEKSRLHYYSSLFNTLEVNSSFYKIPQFSTFEKWSGDVYDNFQFSLKLHQDTTHTKELRGDLNGIKKFIAAAAGVGNKKGCILIQFPGKINMDYFNSLEKILIELELQDPGKEWRKAVEFRNHEWYTGETFELLDEYNSSIVVHDFPKGNFYEIKSKASFVYQRFHGPKGDYKDSYTDSFLENKSKLIKEWLARGKDVYVYFNNTIGNAFNNAMSLKLLLDPQSE